MKLKLTIIFLCISAFCFSQSRLQIIDSLKVIVKTTQNDSIKASAFGRLAWLNMNNNIDMARSYIDSSLSIYEAVKNEKGIAVSKYRQAVINRVSGNYVKALESMQVYMDYVVSKHDTLNIANGHYQNGVIFSLQGNYEKSLEQYYKTLNLYEVLEDSTGMGFTLNSIGIVYKNLKKYPEAIESYHKAINIHKKRNDLNDLANAYNGLGAVFAEQDHPNEAIDYYLKSLAIDEEIDNNWGTAKVSKNIALAYMDKNQYPDALKYLEKALKIQETYNYDSELSETLVQLSRLYRLIKNIPKSKTYMEQAFSHKVPNKKVYQDMHLESYKLFNTVGDYKNALKHYELFSIYKDSIFNEDNLKNINALEIQFDTEKKEKAIIEQELKLNRQEEAYQKKKIQYGVMTGTAIFLLIASILLFLFFKQRQKRKNQEILTLRREQQVKTLEALIEGEENERFRIAKELHDGVNGDLSAIKYKLSSLMEMNNKVIKEAITMIDASCKQVRAISHDLVPPSLENFNLIEATQVYCSNLNSSNPDIDIVFQNLGDEVELPKKSEINIFRIIQELVTNSLKHAKASIINVQISSHNNTIQVAVEDNGIGFNKDEILSKGIGLKNVQSRIDYLNATIDLVSNEKGTSYTIDIDKDQINED